MQMGHAERVQGFVSNMQHAQVWNESLRMRANRGQAHFRRIGTSARQDVLHALKKLSVDTFVHAGCARAEHANGTCSGSAGLCRQYAACAGKRSDLAFARLKMTCLSCFMLAYILYNEICTSAALHC